MSPDDAAYVADLIRTAEHHYAEAVALLNEANRIAGGQARDDVPIVYRDGTRYQPPGGGDTVNPDDYIVPEDPFNALQPGDCCQ